ncbi:MAG: hypothetical protein KAJ14_13840 [Candidatus Omnitrophica bacterium]|nr:hypothetical protein [Candidatus Omnitrophota bacterium]MCK5494187.1 hypothetical protein [Candidatus Omnitrophota bacterium]
MVFGQVKYGEIKEGASGLIAKGKKCTLFKIEKDGKKIFKACDNDEVKLSLKHAKFEDIKPGESISFE